MDPHALPSGVTFLDHTADVGLEVEADTLEELFLGAALGMTLLLEGDGSGEGPVEPDPRLRTLALEADDLPTLLRDWLRELLWWHEVEERRLVQVRFRRLGETALEARVRVAPPDGPPVREIKGVTLHGLEARRAGDGWRARVIFDV